MHPCCPSPSSVTGQRKALKLIWLKQSSIQLLVTTVMIEWVPVSAENRLDAIREGDIDLLIRATTHTVSRDADALWTIPYFLDGQRVLVSADSGITELSDLADETICVNMGTDWETNLLAYMEAEGIPIETLEMGD